MDYKRVQVLWLVLLAMVMMLAGFAMCCLGAFVTYPLAMLAFAVAFTRLSGRMALDRARLDGTPGDASPLG